MRFNEDEVCQIIKAVTYYRDRVTSCTFMWDEYDQLVDKLNNYGEDITEVDLSCPPDK